MLGTLAKWLRILGYDTRYDPDRDDHQLVRLARAEDRVLLTRDRELSRRRGVRSLLIASQDLDEQCLQVVTDLELDLDPDRSYSRCPVCNEALERLEYDQAQARVPAYVARTRRSFKICPACHRIYWRGTHWQRMERRLARLRSHDTPSETEGGSDTNPTVRR
jgi:uncharacterized protein with PIN domain